MTTYIYKGNWNSGISYKIDSAVMFSGDYYKALVVTMPGQSPSTDPSKWEVLPPYAYPSEIYLPLTYDDIVEEHVNPYEIGDNLGLYQFPSKEAINKGSVASNELHFHKLGVEMMYEYAKAYYVANEAYIPKITGIYIVQGERKKNVITQGFSTAAVEAVGFYMNAYVHGISPGPYYLELNQSSKLGTNENEIAFPIIGASDYRLFPVIKLSRRRKGSQDGDAPVWRMEEDAISELLVTNKEEIIEWANLGVSLTFEHAHSYYSIAPSMMSDTQKIRIRNIKTNKFCIYTPDILINKGLTISSSLYIKPIRSLRHSISDNLSISNVGSNVGLSKQEKISSFAHAGKDDGAADSLYMNFYVPRNGVLDLPYTSYLDILPNTQSIYNLSANIIQENQIYSDYGFSTHMKSLIDIFGYDYKTGAADQSTTITAFLNASRQQLYDAGVMLNRTKWSVLDNEVEQPAIILTKTNNTTEYYKTYPFGFNNKQICQFSGDDVYSQRKSLFVVATNLSMRSLPYIGVKRETIGKYGSLATIDSPILQIGDSGYEEVFTEDDYRALHNSIVNLCLYKNNDDYRAAVYNSFNLLSEQYRVIGYNDVWNESGSGAYKYYRGDVFSQKTFMRCIRWSGLPDIMTTPGQLYDWSYSWKFGQAINIYLQSFVNTYLRIPEHDSMYYPYVKTFFNSNQEAIDNFVWKNTSMRYLKETWKTNDGYNTTHGLWAFYAYDELLMKRSYLAANRIYASNVHVGGAIVDQYRNIPSGQFMDYNFEGGDIVKLVKFNNTMFTIQKYAIIQHYQSRELKTAEDSSTIITGDKAVLNDFYRHLENYGTSHKESIVNGTMGIYGVDWDKEKIWRIKQEYGSEGGVYFLCENLVESKTVYDIFKIIKKDNNQLVQNLYGDNMTGIVSTYDEENKQILFTFHLGLNNDTVPKHIYYTLAFSEEMDAFVGFLSYNSNYYIKFDNRLLSFSWGQAKTSQDLWEHNTGEYLKLYGTKQDMELTFIVNGVSEQQNAGNFEKEFQAHLINSSHDVFDIVSWETEWQSSEKNPFINANEFWSNPEYKEHTWRVPIIPNTKIINSGPLGTNNFSTFETNSSMRGQWIKVTLKYKPKSDVDLQFYIKNVITNFLISYS